MSDLFTIPVLLGIIYSGIRLATPYLFAAIGETFAQASGVLNLGVEGIMLMGAFSGFYTVLQTGNLWLGILVAAVVGLVMGLLMAFVSVTLKAEQGISGIGLSLFGLGLSSLLFERWVTSLTSINGFQPVRIPILGSIPYIGDTFFNHSVLVYIAFLLVPVSSYIFSHTTLGLKIRAVGQHPQAADSVGISVVKIRYLTVSFGGLMAGIAGASLPLALISLFQENMTNGMGYIAVALVYFGGWRPRGVLGGSLLFSFVNAFQLWMQVKGVKIPSNIALMMPYVLTILALTFAVNRARQPAALDKPFERGES